MLTVGDAVTWEYVVTNTGDVPLSDVTVTDDQAGVTPAYVSGDDNGDNILQPGEIWIYRANGIAVIGQYANTGTATGTPPEGEDVSDSDPSHYYGEPADAPSIDMEKSTNGVDADEPTGPVLTVGDAVNWEYVVKNTGNVTLSDVTVTDDQTGVTPAFDSELQGNGDSSFDEGEIWRYTATGTAVAGQYMNIGTATGTAPAGGTVFDSDPSHYLGIVAAVPSIDIEKSTNGQDADEPTGPLLTVGDAVTWEYRVENTGTVALSNVAVTDNQTGVTPAYVSGDGGDNILEPGEVWIYRATGSAIEGQYANIGTATGTPPAGGNISDSDPSHYLGKAADAPSIDVEKYISLVSNSGLWDDADDTPGPQAMAGDSVWFRFVIENTGNVALTSVTLTDNVFDLSTNCGAVPELAPGDTYECVIGPMEATGEAHTNTASAIGSHDGQTVEDDDPAHYAGSFWSFTPGFWKNHAKGKHDAWKYTEYGTGDPLAEVFAGAGCLGDYRLDKKGKNMEQFLAYTLLEALSFQGNETISGAMEILLRAAVASLLNASFHETMGNPIGDGGVYPYTTAEVIGMVEGVLCSGNRAMILDLAAQLDDLNNGIHYIDWKWPAP
jgi:hypothetical protein